jgi:hypothetical protein
MPDSVSVLWRLFSVTWLGVPVASFAVLVVGGLMYVACRAPPQLHGHTRWLYAGLAGSRGAVLEAG